MSAAARRVDLNADLAEEITDDEALLGVVSSANVACGYHAGTPAVIGRACELAVERGVVIGAQVSYADRPNFGRVRTDVPMEILREQIAHQVGLLAEHAAAAGGSVEYVKPHGALYHRVLDDEEQAWALLDGSMLDGHPLPLLGMPGEAFDAAALGGRATVLEGFPDRGYGDDGRLLSREEPGAVLDDSRSIAEAALSLAERVDSLCLHGDTPGAVDHARAVRDALGDAGWEVRSWLR